MAETVSEAGSLPLTDTARLFALESMALADTVAPTYSTKYLSSCDTRSQVRPRGHG